ncbi:MAG: crotonase/enoyl-CoA hydratase family protein [Actinomycetota bacterium]|nr:crotonase/enoyl-CoA hydratase family protein [Acidimicrobiia bacterium]MDQ3294426.1 crotonase/enoyl-CoA hydratase family protein [Actinomycetota bacterium]
MSDVLDYTLDGGVAVLTLDDGKANAISPTVIAELHAALDRAAGEAHAVLLVGRPGRFSAGFDLSIMTRSTEDMRSLVTSGGELLLRLFTFPMPVVAAVTGHALAAGALLLLASDVRIAADVPAKVGLNEVAIGMGLPEFAMELARYRMPPSQFDTALLGRVFSPADAVGTGYVDRVVPADELLAAATAEAHELSHLSSSAVAQTKAAARGALVDRVLPNITANMATITGPTS